MAQNALYQVSLIAAFVAGMVALFAPCCISYLLPAYFGNIFKEKKRVLFMTLIYSLGIFLVLLPVVLGAKALSLLFFKAHDFTYIAGGMFMLFVAVISLIGIKLPMPKFAMGGKPKNDILSTFTLGVFSGITSACCAPVLVGVLALSSLSSSLFQALGVGLSYVLGMVAPLYLASLVVEKKNILEKPLLKRKLGMIRLGKKEYPVFVSNLVAAAIFSVTGTLMIVFSSVGMLGMPSDESGVTQLIQNTAIGVTEATGNIPGINLIFAITAIFLLYKLVKSASRRQ